MTEELKD